MRPACETGRDPLVFLMFAIRVFSAAVSKAGNGMMPTGRLAVLSRRDVVGAHCTLAYCYLIWLASRIVRRTDIRELAFHSIGGGIPRVVRMPSRQLIRRLNLAQL